MRLLFSLLAGFLLLPLVASDRYPIDSSIDVISYDFTIYLSDKTDSITGEAAIRISHTGLSDIVWFDLAGEESRGRGMRVGRVSVDGEAASFVHEDGRLGISLPVTKYAGTGSRITITYSGIPADGLIISRNRYGERTFFADNWPDRARNWIPCVDHPSDKAKVDFRVYAPVHYQVVANGRLVEQVDMPEGIRYTHYSEEVSISTKVMVIGAARFASRMEAVVGGTEIWTHVFPSDREAGYSDYAVTVKPFLFFSDYVGPYPYEKLSNVQSKTMFGGMENAGCIFYSERSVTGRNGAESLMAHEIAHQWFGNSVTERDWHHVWLSEGFATFLTSYYLAEQYGDSLGQSLRQRSRDRVVQAWMQRPAPVIDTTITDFMKRLSTNSYQKGAWVLHMLLSELGEDTFTRVIRTYYSRFRNQTAVTDDFRRVAEEISQRDLAIFFHQWLYRPDLPQLGMEWSYNSRRKEVEVTVRQVQEGDPFSINVEVEVTAAGRRSVEVVELGSGTGSLIIRSESRPERVVLDPGVKLPYAAAR